MLASVLDSGPVYYSTILALPVVTGAALAIWRPERRALWILVAVVAAFTLFDFALDDTRSEDVAFFVVLALFMFGLGLFARFLAKRVMRTRPRPS